MEEEETHDHPLELVSFRARLPFFFFHEIRPRPDANGSDSFDPRRPQTPRATSPTVSAPTPRKKSAHRAFVAMMLNGAARESDR